jgi:hypothetical protein
MGAMRAFVIAALALSAISSAQIPDQAKWEITFAQVESSIGLSDLRTASPQTFEARVMQRPWSAVAPLPFLRLTGTDGKVRAQLFMFWAANRFPAGRAPAGPEVSCRDGVCAGLVDITEQRDWNAVAKLAHANACPVDPDRTVGVCGDCDQVWIKTMARGRYQEQSCPATSSETPAAVLLQVLKNAAAASKY